MAAVVHHGGAGTTTTAARAGAPQVLVPHVLDQFYWARRVEALGIGVGRVARRRLSFAGLRDALAAVLDAEIVAERAREIGARLRRDADSAADSVAALLGE
jgi:vancomycin aglycone glucosyltransferase